MALNDPQSADQILHDENCTVEFEIYEDFQHIESDETDEILGSIEEFCAAFYHVPGTNNIRDKCCLDEGNCKVGNTLPRSVAALVKYEINDGNDIIVRYSNHYIPDATKHAEEFFSDDIKNTTASSSVSGTTLERITMYITSQPCHLSTTNTPDKSCCNVLLELLEDPRLENVEMCIKFAHIYRAGSGDEHAQLVENGKEGIKLLNDAPHIEVTGMEEDDWNFLYNLVAMDDDERGRIPPYSGSERKDLDEEIGEFLDQLIQPSPSDTDDLNLPVDNLHITGPSD